MLIITFTWPVKLKIGAPFNVRLLSPCRSFAFGGATPTTISKSSRAATPGIAFGFAASRVPAASMTSRPVARPWSVSRIEPAAVTNISKRSGVIRIRNPPPSCAYTRSGFEVS